MQLTTDRLCLREVRPEDESVFVEYSQHADFRQYENPLLVEMDAMASMVRYMIMTQEDRPRVHYYFAITLKDKPIYPLGAAYISIRDQENLQGEVGYIMGVPHWKNGYATEATARIVEFGFRQLDMHRIYADEIITENIASVRVAEKLGMRREAHLRDYRYFQDRWWDTYTYAILEDEWWELQSDES